MLLRHRKPLLWIGLKKKKQEGNKSELAERQKQKLLAELSAPEVQRYGIIESEGDLKADPVQSPEEQESHCYSIPNWSPYNL